MALKDAAASPNFWYPPPVLFPLPTAAPGAGCPLCLYLIAIIVLEQGSGYSCASCLPAHCECWQAAANFPLTGHPSPALVSCFISTSSSLPIAIVNSSLLWIVISFLFISCVRTELDQLQIQLSLLWPVLSCQYSWIDPQMLFFSLLACSLF